MRRIVSRWKLNGSASCPGIHFMDSGMGCNRVIHCQVSSTRLTRGSQILALGS